MVVTFLFPTFYFLILAPYFLKSGNELCTGAKEKIGSLEECKVAVKAISSMNLVFVTTENSAYYPEGCYTLNGGPKVYWNIKKGKARENAQPICKRGE